MATRTVLFSGTSLLGAVLMLASCGGSDEGGGGSGGHATGGSGTGATAGSGAKGGTAGTGGSGGAIGGGSGGSLAGGGGVAGSGATGCKTAPDPVPGASGKIINVAPTGSDTTGDGSASKPFRTLSKACGAAAAGDAIELAAGTWKTAGEKCTANGTVDKPIHIRPHAGESVAFDATGASLAANDAAVLIQGSNLVFDGFEVMNSSGRGVSYYQATGINLRNLKVHDLGYRALGGSGTDIVIENNEVFNAALSNVNGVFGSSGWPGVVQNALYPDGTPSKNVIVRNNHIHDSWGECVIAGAVDGARVEGNRIHDCFSVDVYIDAGANITIDRNQLYATSSKYDRPDTGMRASGINLATEAASLTQLVKNVVIYDNIITETGKGISYWHDSTNTKPNNTWQGVKILHNVIAHTLNAAVQFDSVGTSPAASSGQIVDNVIYAGAQGGALTLGDPAAWQISKNAWPDGKPALDTSSGSFSGDPGLVSPVSAAQPDGFRLTASSPCHAAGAPAPEVTFDFWCRARSATAPSIGVHEP